MNAPTPLQVRGNPVLELFSSVRFGIILLTLILIYASVLSAVMPARVWLEVTEMEAFQHWLFAVLIILFCITLSVTTIRRIRWNVTNLGVLTVHTGLLLLAIGSVVYFGRKVEGDVLLLSPRIELVSLSGASMRLPRFLAETGSTWETTAPMLGGNVRFSVVETEGSGLNVVERARVRIEIAGQPPREVTLDATHAPQAGINATMALRLSTFPPESKFYDKEIAALYVHPPGTPHEQMVSRRLNGLPLHAKRYLPDEDGVLTDRNGRPAPSNRTSPALDLGFFSIPMGWLAHWRLPLAVAAADLPFDVQVTGYLPYIAGMLPTAVDGGAEQNPAIRLRIDTPTGPLSASLFANDPKSSLLNTDVPIEFRWVGSDAERETELAARPGPHELQIEVRDPPVRQTIPIIAGQVIQVPGTTYELRVEELIQRWPLMSAGFEGVASPVARIDVNTGTRKYNRTVVQRFAREAPLLTQDIDEAGTRHREPVDANLVLRYRTSAQGWMTLVAGPTADSPVELGLFDEAGRVQRFVLGRDGPTPVAALGQTSFSVLAVFEKARSSMVPVIENAEMMRPGFGRAPSTIRVRLTGRDALSGWSETRWVQFSHYPHRDTHPERIRTPDGREWDIVYSRVQHDLGGALALRKLRTEHFPGRQMATSWYSYVVGLPQGADGPVDGVVSTNRTWGMGEWTYFQSGASNEDDWSFTILGVGNREGIWPMVLGCVLVPLGCLYAFYVKPVLKRRAAERAIAAAAERQRRAAAAAPETELVQA